MKMVPRVRLCLLAGATVLAGVGLAVFYYAAPSSEQQWDVADTEGAGERGAAASQAVVERPWLPAETRPALRAFIDPQAAERLPRDFDYQVDRVTDADEVAAVVALLRNRSESDTMRHEAANLLRRSDYEGLEQVLIDCLQHPEETERFRSWAVQHLFMVFAERQADGPTAASALLAPLLDDPQPAVRREALLSLHRLDAPAGPDVVATAVAWLDDPATVDLALRVLRERDARDYLPQVRAVLVDETAAPPARIAAIVTVSDWGDYQSRDALARLANLPDQPANVRLRRSAQMALERLTP